MQFRCTSAYQCEWANGIAILTDCHGTFAVQFFGLCIDLFRALLISHSIFRITVASNDCLRKQAVGFCLCIGRVLCDSGYLFRRILAVRLTHRQNEVAIDLD